MSVSVVDPGFVDFASVVGRRGQRVVILEAVAGDAGLGRHHVRIQRQLRFQFADVLEFGQRRQFVQALEPEIVEEALGGAEQGRLSGYVAVADHPDPLPLLQRLDDVAAHRHAADLFDLATGDGLAVGDQGQGLQGGAGVAGLAFGPQPGHPVVHLGLDLVAEAGSDLDQFHSAVLAGGGQLLQRRFHAARRRRGVLGKQPVQLGQRQGLVGRQQCGLDDAVDQRLVHGSRG